MRVIKFRAWDTTQKEPKMVQWDELKEFPAECIFLPPNQEVFLMQFTGLKDSTGKDIYEGDILDFTEDGKNRFSVEFHDASFYKIWANDPSMSLLEYIGDSKIIGNIHENPELLKD